LTERDKELVGFLGLTRYWYGPDTWVTTNSRYMGDSSDDTSVTGSQHKGDSVLDDGATRCRNMGDQGLVPETVDVRDMGDTEASGSADDLENDVSHG